MLCQGESYWGIRQNQCPAWYESGGAHDKGEVPACERGGTLSLMSN